MATRSYRRNGNSNIWPGFVDAISTLLIIVIFLLMIFTVAQFFLSETLSGRNDALDRLNRQIVELGEVLALEKKSNEDLRQEVAQLSTELQGSISARDSLQQSIVEMTSDRDRLAGSLSSKTQELEVNREKIRIQLASLQSLNNDIEALKKVRARLETKVSSLAATLEKNKADLTAARDRNKTLEAKLNTAAERTALAQKEIEKKNIRLSQIQDSAAKSAKFLKDEQILSEKARARVALLHQQIAALRQQLARISGALEASEAKARSQNVQIINLGSRLNEALANKVEELARFRSEFFGKLRDALGNTKGVRVEGDRFVFQSEVLFPSGSSSMFGAGQNQISQLAGTLKDIAARIPKDVDWILRVDGHTDDRPIKTAQFPSNWELSSARAIAVVKQLVARGIPPHRLAATGFGEFRPLDTRPGQAGLSRNRRIEFKLTGR
ncbi:MAG: peptidoglycan -binding protein [Alphaproteobacteria bacterium]|jgi:chemotaxis protein MotB